MLTLCASSLIWKRSLCWVAFVPNKKLTVFIANPIDSIASNVINVMNTHPKIIIDPRSNYMYGSLYLYGLITLFGKENVSFSMKPFKEMSDVGGNFRFIAVNDSVTKYYIHTDDTYRIRQSDYQWCDVYGHVNANFKETPKHDYPKVVSLVPSFGIKALSDRQALFMALHNFLKAMPTILKRGTWNKSENKIEINYYNNIKHYFGKIYKTNKGRAQYSDYLTPCMSEDNYVFFCSTLWYDDDYNRNDSGVNLRRANFMRACKTIPGLVFEGGFVADAASSRERFGDLLTSGVSLSDWIAKTKKSALVFNTPAFWNCHGWKLGEYLALGKCIISTPLSNDLPAPLEHGIHIHYVDSDIDALREAIKYILSHKNYRLKLEYNARAYWDKYGTPENALHLMGL